MSALRLRFDCLSSCAPLYVCLCEFGFVLIVVVVGVDGALVFLVFLKLLCFIPLQYYVRLLNFVKISRTLLGELTILNKNNVYKTNCSSNFRVGFFVSFFCCDFKWLPFVEMNENGDTGTRYIVTITNTYLNTKGVDPKLAPIQWMKRILNGGDQIKP